MPMAKTELTDKIHRDLKHHISKNAITEMVRDIFTCMEEKVCQNGSFSVSDFGRFYVIETKEKTGTHPQTHETITIPETKRIRFKAATPLKKRVR